MVKAQYGKSDPFSKVLELATPLLLLVRNTRNCLEHGDLNGVITTDFDPQADGTNLAPSIEVDVRKSKHDRCPISLFMDRTTKALLGAFEMIVVHMCAKCIQSFAGIPVLVGPLCDEYKKAWHVRFAYGSYGQDGRFTPGG